MSARVFYRLADGAIVGTSTGGGALADLSSQALLEATFPGQPELVASLGVLEDFDLRQLGDQRETAIDLSRVEAYQAAQQSHRASCEARGRYIFETTARNGAATERVGDFERALRMAEARGNPKAAATRAAYDDLCACCDADCARLEACCRDCCTPISLEMRRQRDEELGHLVGDVWCDPSSYVPAAYGDTVTRQAGLVTPEEEGRQ